MDKELLKDLDEGALRLYLYFGFVADNDFGHSWHSIETISEYFGKQTRTIDHWIKKLVDAGLIYRAKDKKKSYTRFLIPYTDTIIEQKPNKKHLEISFLGGQVIYPILISFLLLQRQHRLRHCR